MRPSGLRRVPAALLGLILTLASLSSCGISAAPDPDRPERFEFISVPASNAEAIALLEDFRGGDDVPLVPGSVVALGKLPGSGGDRVFVEFSVVDPRVGPMDCLGTLSASSGGWGCSSGGEPDLDPDTLQLASSGASEGWNEVEFRVGANVAYIVAVAEDGTAYRIEPLGGFAWMEWKSAHGTVVAKAFDANDRELTSVPVDDPG